MYEIWLMLNIVWEIALEVIVPIVILLLIWLVFIGLAARNPLSNWRGAARNAVVLGLVVAIVAMIALPGLTRSSTSELAYIVDWLALIGMSLGFGSAAEALAWPVLATLRKPTSSPRGRLQGSTT